MRIIKAEKAETLAARNIESKSFPPRWQVWWPLPVLALALLAALLYRNAKRPQHLPGLGGVAVVLAYSPDGKIACASDNGFVQMWRPDIRKWRSFRDAASVSDANINRGGVPPQSRQLARRLVFSNDGAALYGGGVFEFARPADLPTRWDVRSRQSVYAFGIPSSSLFDVTRDGHWAVNALTSGLVVFDLTRPKPSPPKTPSGPRVFWGQLWPMNGEAVIALAFAPSGKTLVAWEGGSVVTVYEVPPGAVSQTLEVAPRPAALSQIGPPRYGTLAWSPDGRTLAAFDGVSLQTWDLQNQSERHLNVPSRIDLTKTSAPTNPGTPPPLVDLMPALSWSPDSTRLASGGYVACLWNVPDLQLQRQLRAQGGVAFAPDGSTLATGGFEGAHEILLWPLKIWPF